MSDQGPDQVAVTPPARHRWLRREFAFVIAAVVVIAVVALVMSKRSAPYVARGAPVGVVPAGAPAVATPQTAAPPR